MDARRKEIEHLETEVRRLEQQITLECVEIGRRVAGLDPQSLRHEELLKYLNSVDTLRRSAESFRADIDRIRALSRQIEVRSQEIDENARRRDALLRERQGRFVELGAGAFALFKTIPEREPYRGYFEEVLKLDLEIEHRHEELKALEADEQGKGFFERLKLKARKVMLRGDISRLDREKTAAYEHAGAKVADSDLARFAEGPLRHVFEGVQERKRAADALAAESDRKVEEIEACRQELKRLEAGEHPEEKIRDLEKRIEGMGKELDVMYCWTGQLFLERDLRRDVTDGNLSAKYEIVSGLRESIRKKRAQIDRLKAELEIEEIVRQEREKRARRKQIEEEMRVKERQIGVIDLEINMGIRRMEELKRVLTGDAPYVDAPPFPPSPDFYPPGDGHPPKP
jgi:hypothetical protein